MSRYLVWRVAVFVAASICPLYWLLLAGIGELGPDPGKVLVENLGLGALVLLLLTLSMSPLQWLSGWGGWIAVRRQLGLWCFTYALLHMLSYLVFIAGLQVTHIVKDLVERPYIIVGALGFIGLLLLAATSNRASIRKLGRRWKSLHRSVYPILVLALLHMLWVVRADLAEWSVYAAIGAVLLLVRLPAIAGPVRRLRFFEKKVGNGA